MNCATHAEVPAAAYCIRCGRALCTECTRNVRGNVYCESCLADIVGGKAGAGSASTTPPPTTPPQAKKVAGGTNPHVAFALGLIPGVGAIYNGEFMKAAVHVLIFGILTSFADRSGSGGPLLGMAITAFYIYMPFEAYYTAKKRELALEGIDLETPIDRLHEQFGQMHNKELWGGGALVVIGALFLADNFDVVRLDRIGRLWPVALIGLGIWMLKRFQGKAT
jgi:hypothetical protein